MRDDERSMAAAIRQFDADERVSPQPFLGIAEQTQELQEPALPADSRLQPTIGGSSRNDGGSETDPKEEDEDE